MSRIYTAPETQYLLDVADEVKQWGDDVLYVTHDKENAFIKDNLTDVGYSYYDLCETTGRFPILDEAYDILQSQTSGSVASLRFRVIKSFCEKHFIPLDEYLETKETSTQEWAFKLCELYLTNDSSIGQVTEYQLSFNFAKEQLTKAYLTLNDYAQHKNITVDDIVTPIAERLYKNTSKGLPKNRAFALSSLDKDLSKYIDIEAFLEKRATSKKQIAAQIIAVTFSLLPDKEYFSYFDRYDMNRALQIINPRADIPYNDITKDQLVKIIAESYLEEIISGTEADRAFFLKALPEFFENHNLDFAAFLKAAGLDVVQQLAQEKTTASKNDDPDQTPLKTIFALAGVSTKGGLEKLMDFVLERNLDTQATYEQLQTLRRLYTVACKRHIDERFDAIEQEKNARLNEIKAEYPSLFDLAA